MYLKEKIWYNEKFEFLSVVKSITFFLLCIFHFVDVNPLKFIFKWTCCVSKSSLYQITHLISGFSKKWTAAGSCPKCQNGPYQIENFHWIDNGCCLSFSSTLLFWGKSFMFFSHFFHGVQLLQHVTIIDGKERVIDYYFYYPCTFFGTRCVGGVGTQASDL